MRNVAYAFLAVLVGGCSGIQVKTARTPNADVTQRRTFAFMAPVDPKSQAAQLERSPEGQTIEQQITKNLVDKGYVPAQPGQQPDFLVAYRTKLRERTQVTDYGYPGPWGWGWGWGWGGWAWGGPDVVINNYTQGTLIVDFVDPQSRSVLWRGTATAVVKDPDNPNLDKVAKAVDKMLVKYPSQAVASTNRYRM